MLLQKVGGDVAQAHTFQLGERGLDDLGALGFVAAQDFGGCGRAIDYNAIEEARAGVFVDGANVVGDGIMLGLAGLRHQVGDIDACRAGVCDDFGDVFDQQVGNDAGVERAGADRE